MLGLVVIRVQAGVRGRHRGQEARGEDHHCHRQQQTMAQQAQRVLMADGFHVLRGRRKATGPAMQACKAAYSGTGRRRTITSNCRSVVPT